LTSTDYFSKKSEITKAYKLLEDNFGMKDAIYLVLEKEEGIFLPFDDRNIDEIIAELSQYSEVSSVDFPRNVPITALILASRTQPLLRYYIADAKTIRISINLSPEGADNLERLQKSSTKL